VFADSVLTVGVCKRRRSKYGLLFCFCSVSRRLLAGIAESYRLERGWTVWGSNPGRFAEGERHGMCELAWAVQRRHVGYLPAFGTVGEWQSSGRVEAGERLSNGMVCVN
jgi:hypothetical protein